MTEKKQRQRIAKMIADSVLREMRKWDGVGGPELASQMGYKIDSVARRLSGKIVRIFTEDKVDGDVGWYEFEGER
jgi:hypothetical protein